jgi:hypothetical protein
MKKENSKKPISVVLAVLHTHITNMYQHRPTAQHTHKHYASDSRDHALFFKKMPAGGPDSEGGADTKGDPDLGQASCVA